MRPFKLVLLAMAIVLLAPGEGAADGGLRRQAYLGASLSAPTSLKAGAEVTAVEKGTAAAKAGLSVGDRILKINGRLLDDPIAFDAIIAGLRGGDTADLEVLRGGRLLSQRIALPPLPSDEIEGTDLFYDSVLTDRGHRLRTILTRPKGSRGRLPGLFLAGWLSCDSVEIPVGPRDGFARLLRGLASQSGFAMMRMDKPGVGDSEGSACGQTDFQTELAGYRAAFQAFLRYDFVDPERIFVLGMSNGGGFAPLVTGDAKVRGFISSGAWAKTWFEHMMEIERRRLTLSGSPPGEVSDRMRGYAELYDAYLNGKKAPGEVVRERPHLTHLWPGLPGHQYGRPAAFYQQLQALNLAAVWEKVESPVLVLYGEHDWIMSREDHEMIAAIVNRRRPGTARFVAIPRMSHAYYIHESPEKSFRDHDSGSFYEPIVPLIVDWMKEQIS